MLGAQLVPAGGSQSLMYAVERPAEPSAAGSVGIAAVCGESRGVGGMRVADAGPQATARIPMASAATAPAIVLHSDLPPPTRCGLIHARAMSLPCGPAAPPGGGRVRPLTRAPKRRCWSADGGSRGRVPLRAQPALIGEFPAPSREPDAHNSVSNSRPGVGSTRRGDGRMCARYAEPSLDRYS